MPQSALPEGVNAAAVDAVMRHSESIGAARLVLLAIARFINADTGTAYPSYETIQKLAKVSRRSVSRSLEDLEDLGEISRSPHYGEHDTNLYRLPKLDAWVNMTLKQPVHKYEVIEEYEIEGRKKFKKVEKINRSSRVTATPAPDEMVSEEVVRLSYAFTDALIASGRKRPRFRSDALKPEWLHDLDQLLTDRFYDGGKPESIDAYVDLINETQRLLEYAATTDIPGTNRPIRQPQQVRQHWRDLVGKAGCESGVSETNDVAVIA